MKISPKIFVAFVLIAILNISPSWIRLNHTEHAEIHIQQILESNLSEQEGISQIAYYLQRAKSNIRELLLEIQSRPSEAELANAEKAVLESLSGMEINLKLLEKAVLKGSQSSSFNDQQSEINSVGEIAVNIKKFSVDAKVILEVKENIDDSNFYIGLFKNKVEPLSRILQKQIEVFKVAEFEETHEEIASMAEHIKDSRKYVLLLSLITFIVSIIVGFVFARNIPNAK